ncbi:MAG: hypothetical protein WD356_05830, partial [Pseudomonadales bacterium]
MKRLTCLVGLITLIFVISACEQASVPSESESESEPDSEPNANAQLDQLIEDYTAAYWEAYPGRATRAGLRGYDDRLPPMSADDFDARAQALREVLEHLNAIDPDNLDTPDHKVDWQLLGQ